MNLEKVISHGYCGLKMSAHVIHPEVPPFEPDYNNIITCADGFQFSVIAGPGTYCSPKPATMYGAEPMWGETVPFTYPGPYTEVEVGYPSDIPEPWEPIDCELCWKEYAEDQDEPLDTVYAYVPVDMVRALVRLHGGELDLPLEECYFRDEELKEWRRARRHASLASALEAMKQIKAGD